MNLNYSAADRLKNLIHIRPELMRLILVNVAVWFFLALVQLGGFLSFPAELRGDKVWLEAVIRWIGVPASTTVLFAKPWTILTYMFVQEEFLHLFFNMIWLFWFGKIFLEFLKGNKIYTIYLLGGIAGALTFLLAYNIFPVFNNSVASAYSIGASASVLAITIATAVLVPNYSINLLFIGEVKIKYIAIFMVILDVLLIRSGNAGGHFAHLGGALAGLIYGFVAGKSLKSLFGFGKFNFGAFNFFKRKPLRKVHSSSKPLTDEEYNRERAIKQKKIDHILDKISRSGYTSLSSEEKDILFKSSKN